MSKKFLTGISFTDDTSDPSPQDDKSVKSADIKNESFDYKLSKDEISALRALQTAYLKRGGKLHAGKVYDYSSEGRHLSAGEIRNGRRGMTAEQYEQWKTREEFRKSEILPIPFGTPSKLQDLKHVVIKIPPGAAADADGILRTYIGERYGGGNLWADKLNEIRDFAKQSGVKLENITAQGGTAEFDISGRQPAQTSPNLYQRSGKFQRRRKNRPNRAGQNGSQSIFDRSRRRRVGRSQSKLSNGQASA